jgi:[ribosomal protein S5]-alanine N-acetyltransferase
MPRRQTPAPSLPSPAYPVCVELVPPPEGLIIRSHRMLLRPLDAADREAFLAAARASRESLDSLFPLWRDGESDDSMFDRQHELARPAAATGFRSARYLRLVGVLTDGQIAGGFHMNAIVRGLEGTADLTWWVASPLEGRGLATEGLSAMADFALGDLPDGLGIQQVHASISRDNRASARVAEKAGFRRAGEERTYLSTGDSWVLHDLYTRGVADGRR